VPDETRQALRHSTIPGDPRSWTQRVGALVHLPALLRELGADPGAVLADADLAPTALDHGDDTIPYASFGRLLALGAARGGCPHVGVLVGRLYRIDDLGAVGDLMRHSATVGDALRALAVHQQVNSGGGLAYLTERPGVAEFGYAIYQPGVAGAAADLRQRARGGRAFPARAVRTVVRADRGALPHVRPADVTPYRSHFHVVPRFDAEVGLRCASRHRGSRNRSRARIHDCSRPRCAASSGCDATTWCRA
jgi:hypothetical protein